MEGQPSEVVRMTVCVMCCLGEMGEVSGWRWINEVVGVSPEILDVVMTAVVCVMVMG